MPLSRLLPGGTPQGQQDAASLRRRILGVTGRPHYHPRSCRVCGVTSEVEQISQTGLCPEHGDARMIAAKYQLKAGAGPHYDRWRQRLAAALGGVLVTDLEGE